MLQKLTDPQPVPINLLIGAIIGFTLGYVLGQVWAWLVGGLIIGALVGLAAQRLFQRLHLTRRGALRGLLMLTILEASLIVYLLLPTLGANASIHPLRVPVKVTPQDLGLVYEPVSLTTQDGLTIKGWYIPGNNRAAVIALHGSDGNRSHVIYHAEALHRAGFGVLALDLRAQGESGGDVFDWLCYRDALAGLRYLQTRPDLDPQRIGGLGLSSGAHALIYATAYDPGLAAIWSDGAGLGDTSDALDPMLPSVRPYFFMTPFNWMYYRMMSILGGNPPSPAFKSVLPAIAPRPARFIGAGNDPIEAEAAQRYASLAGPNAAAWIIPNTNHVGGIFSAAVEYKARLVEFFTQALLTDTP